MPTLVRKPPSVPESRRLAVRFARKVFSAMDKPTNGVNAETAFAAELQRSFRATYLRPLRTAQELLLDKDCRLPGSFKLSVQALGSICRLLGLGLSQTVFDIGGVDEAGTDERPTDLDLAIRLFNDAVKLRFAARLKEKRLVMDRQYQQVDGLVGPRYELYHNLKLYEHADRWLASGPVPVKFHEAILSGRRMSLRYRTVEPLFEVPDNRTGYEPFFGGYHLGNSETGDCSVKAAVVIIRQWCDNKALAEFAGGGSVKHISNKQFEQRLHQLLERVQLRPEESATFKRQIIRLMGRPLGLGGDEERHVARSECVVRRLEQAGMTSRLAKQVLDRTLSFGSYRNDAVAPELLSRETALERWASRTEYDVFNAITFVAKAMAIESQERLEQVAYRLMLGKFSPATLKET